MRPLVFSWEFPPYISGGLVKINIPINYLQFNLGGEVKIHRYEFFKYNLL